MKLEIRTSINIKGTPSEIWKALIDTKQYHTWNPFIQSLAGEMVKGNQIKVALGGMKFTPYLLNVEENKELRWLGKLGFTGVFDGEHYFLIEDCGDGSCDFIHGEKFKGFLVRLLKSKLEGETKNGFIAMNKALKSYVEEGV